MKSPLPPPGPFREEAEFKLQSVFWSSGKFQFFPLLSYSFAQNLPGHEPSLLMCRTALTEKRTNVPPISQMKTWRFAEVKGIL